MQISRNGWQRDINDCAIQNRHRNTYNNHQDGTVSLWEEADRRPVFFHKYFVIKSIMI